MPCLSSPSTPPPAAPPAGSKAAAALDLQEAVLVTRQRTPPVVKWVANELAALKGEVADLDQRIAQLQARRNAVYSKVEALSQVFGTVAPELPLTLVPVVHAHGPYGGRGKPWLTCASLPSCADDETATPLNSPEST